ncbi:alpha/beta fold hydrolase [Robbsia sp. Bb-Pol-6]|uniref:Alpha/beta fold hydrolase n=1 Tax=Robbsia betulipollinis TaxID=2981849 RepID=A0ABT3ZLJ3_9BURK|nr:alpha/beta fold hydrolase [Robbsia betulipollinis]MCY0387413.1 alpha/beta fold hydrolase [Robbsia betulipollinis]
MNLRFSLRRLAGLFVTSAAMICAASSAAAAPTPVQGDWVAPSFAFHDGETLKAMRLHYITLGDPGKPAILVLHGTNQTAQSMLAGNFAGELFGPGQPLDANKYFIVIPDGIGAGKSAKPSDGLRASFPKYDYNDMVLAEYRLLTEGLGIEHLRLVIGHSMGGMQTWLFAGRYPDFTDGFVPMAAQPTQMAARNWALRAMLIESIKRDPAWDHGNYTTQPPSLQLAGLMFNFATNGGTLAYEKNAGTHAQTDKMVEERLAVPVAADANDYLYQFAASADYDAMPNLQKIRAPVLAIFSRDDERNPLITGTVQATVRRLPHGQLLVIPASTETYGHNTTFYAKFYASRLARFVATLSDR